MLLLYLYKKLYIKRLVKYTLCMLYLLPPISLKMLLMSVYSAYSVTILKYCLMHTTCLDRFKTSLTTLTTCLSNAKCLQGVIDTELTRWVAVIKPCLFHSLSLAWWLAWLFYPNCGKGALMPEGASSMTDDYRIISIPDITITKWTEWDFSFQSDVDESVAMRVYVGVMCHCKYR